LSIIGAFASGSVSAQTRNDYCGSVLPSVVVAERAHTGHYLNSTFGYSLALPAGLAAYGDGRAPERGFIIVLSQTPRATLSVDAAYDIFYDITAEGVHRRDINTIRLHDTLSGDQTLAGALAGTPGGRYSLQFQCRGESEALAHEEVIVVRNREIYRVDLQTTVQRYATDLGAFNAVLKSWRWVRPRPP
jgi:hypothetical protein